MKLLNKKEGFTLIELMIVVVIIGILAAIAIPQFLRYQLKSKTSEAPRNLGAIRTNEEAFYAKYGEFAVAANNPASLPKTKKLAFVTATTSGFATIGFSPSGTVYYQYGVGAAAPTATGFAYSTESVFDASGLPTNGIAAGTIYISAMGDIDGDTVISSFYQTNSDTKITSVPPTAGETIF